MKLEFRKVDKTIERVLNTLTRGSADSFAVSGAMGLWRISYGVDVPSSL